MTMENTTPKHTSGPLEVTAISPNANTGDSRYVYMVAAPGETDRSKAVAITGDYEAACAIAKAKGEKP